MSRLLIESGTDRSMRVDSALRTAKCILITEGLGNLRDKNLYLADAVHSAVQVFEGARCFLDHPSGSEEQDRPERSVRDLCGFWSDCKLGTVRDPNTGDSLAALFATLNFAESEPGQLALDQVMAALAYRKKYPGSKSVYAGFSINAGGLSEPASIDGLGEVNAVHEITDVFSCDLVTMPARGGQALSLSESYRPMVDATVERPRAKSLAHVTPAFIAEAQARVKVALLERQERDARAMGFSESNPVTGKLRAAIVQTLEDVERAMDQMGADPDNPDGLDPDELPMDSIQDDIQRKQSIKRAMSGPDDEQPADESEAAVVGDSKFPEPTDSWKTSERSRKPSQGRSRHETATEAFHREYEESGAGDGMAGADSTRTSPDVSDEDQKLDKSSAEVNYKYALDPSKSCGQCEHLVRGEDGTLGCELVEGIVRLVDTCNLFEPAEDDAEKAFHDSYGDE